MSSLNVSEIFYSIQGEGSLTGLPCIFIRLAGCNLSCSWCDTMYASKGEGTRMEVGVIVQKIAAHPCSLTEITGGEPLIQPETHCLIHALLDAGKQLVLETNGSIDISTVPRPCRIIMDIKTPGSGMHHKMNMNNLDFLKPQDEIKFVLSNRTDYDWAKEIIKKAHIPYVVNFSPVYNKLSLSLLAHWILEDQLNVRLNIQLHKYIWAGKEGICL